MRSVAKSLTQQQHSELSSIAQSRTLPAGYVFRAKLILMLAEGVSFSTIKQQLQTTAPTIIRWKQRFRQSGLEGLDTYHPGQKPSVLTPLCAPVSCPPRGESPVTAPRTGVAASWPRHWTSIKMPCIALGKKPASSRIASNDTWPATIPSSKRKPLTSSVCT